ncbi:MAG: DUF4097 domain-containing protein [Eubacterium sp.]|nr:DUF4097 domain-containing protein [Eubacterium sp.]
MLKACLKLLLTGIIMFFVGVIGIGVLAGTGMIDEDDLSISIPGSSSDTAAAEVVDNGSGGDYTVIDQSETDIKNLYIDIGMGSFTVAKGDEFSISTYGIDRDSFVCDIEGDRLNVEYKPSVKLMSFNFGGFDDDADIVLTVPEKQFDAVVLNMTAGDVYAWDLNTKSLTAKVSAGDMHLGGIYAESADLKMTAGEFTVSDSTLKNTALSMTAGQMYLGDCKLFGDNKIKMTAGELTMSLIGNRRDYAVNIDKALGNITVDGMDADGEYAATTFDTTTVLTEVTVTGKITDGDGVLSHGEEAAGEVSDSNNEKPCGSIDINMTAGDCYIEFIGGNDYE